MTPKVNAVRSLQYENRKVSTNIRKNTKTFACSLQFSYHFVFSLVRVSYGRAESEVFSYDNSTLRNRIDSILGLLEKFRILQIDNDGVLFDIPLLHHLIDNLFSVERSIAL